MHKKPFQINSLGRVQTKQNDLKSAVSEHAKNTGPVQKLLARKTTWFYTRYTRPYKFVSGDQKWTMIRATTLPQLLMEQFCSLVKTRLQQTANAITDERILRVPKALLNFQWTIGVDKIFFCVIKCPNSRISTLSSSMFSYVWIMVSIKHGLWTADHGPWTGYKTRTRYKMWTMDYVGKNC